MNNNTRRRPYISLVILSICLLFLGYSGFMGGYEMLKNPVNPMGMPLSYLERTLFQDYFVPGLLLILLWGLGSLVTLIGLWRPWQLPLMMPFTLWTHEHWAWGFAVLMGLGLIIWLTYQVVMMPAVATIQFILYGLAVLLIVIPLLPPMRRYYQIQFND